MFQTLMPREVKYMVGKMAPFQLNTDVGACHVKAKGQKYKLGIDFTPVKVFLVILMLMLIGVLGLVVPQVRILIKAKDALCAGHRDFVYTIDGFGVTSWTYTGDDPSHNRSAGIGDRRWPFNPREVDLSYPEYTVESVIHGDELHDDHTFEASHCPKTACYNFTSETNFVTSKLPLCCNALDTYVPGVQGSVFSVSTKSRETFADANNVWNTGCMDVLDANAPYKSLLQAAISTTVNEDPCGGCPLDAPLCLVENGAVCVTPNCTNIKSFCQSDSITGTRARQLCPQTCGCAEPRSSLVLFTPSSGCATQCTQTPEFRAAVASTPCIDVAFDDEPFLEFLDQWADIAQSWPKDWFEASQAFVSAFKRWGCAYLNVSVEELRAAGGYPDANYVGMNFCTGSGAPFPIKPISYFCSGTCNCANNTGNCPDTCV